MHMDTMASDLRDDSDSESRLRSRRAQALVAALRRIMRAGANPDDSLMELVALIAGHFSAEVCSLYMLADDGTLVLTATRGLRPEAIGRTRFPIGQGLVGTVAERCAPLVLEAAQDHERFVYRPETGEELFQSFMGVPLVRNHTARGVLVVQNESRRHYYAEDVEACETVAIVLVELLQRTRQVTIAGPGTAADSPSHLTGTALHVGLAIGQAFHHRRDVAIARLRAEDPTAERARLDQAIEQVIAQIHQAGAASGLEADSEILELLDVQAMIARDKGWRNKMAAAIERGLSAEAAVKSVQNALGERLSSIESGPLHDRWADIEDISTRLLQVLTGAATATDPSEIPEDAVLVARRLGPADLLKYPLERLKGLVVAEATPSGHLAIVARSLNIPALGRIPSALGRVADRDRLVVDAEHGQLFIRPPRAVVEQVGRSLERRRVRPEATASGSPGPTVSRDGQTVMVDANIGLLVDLEQVKQQGARGVGLFRTEVAFMIRDRFPTVEEQTRLYHRVLDSLPNQPVVFRTLDIGSDKSLPYFHETGAEDNPAMGWRAVRISLDRPDLLRDQVRALLGAAVGRELKVMFPMIGSVAEFAAARQLAEDERSRWCAAGGGAPTALRIGAMLETPALLWQLESLFAQADFVSIGSNDLFQFLFAADRTNPRTSGRFDYSAPWIIPLLRSIVAAAERAGKPLSLCGDMAGESLGALILLACGFRTLSMAPHRVAAIKDLVRAVSIEDLQARVARVDPADEPALRQLVLAYVAELGLDLESAEG